MTGRLVIDGAYGEGGGQILRTAVAISAITGRALRVENIRAKRPRPGLAAQHVTSVRAAAALCDAVLHGDTEGSLALDFTPRRSVRTGTYSFDVADARKGGSAGAAMLVLQAVLPPLLIAHGETRILVKGGTHVAWSPPFDYIRDVWLPTLKRMGGRVSASLIRSGWYPVGQGEVEVTVTGAGGALSPLTVNERGRLQHVSGRAIVASLPAHIAARMANQAGAGLHDANIEAHIDERRLTAACPGAGIFLTAVYEFAICGFSALGERGKPAETVAQEAVEAFLSFHRSDAAFDTHLADQMIMPMALAAGRSEFTTPRLTNHLATNAWVVQQFGVANVALEARPGNPVRVTVTPHGIRDPG